jgi:electron transfer flavoprotein alpha subunit
MTADTAVAVIVARDGRLPVGAAEAVEEAGGSVVVVGTGAEAAARSLPGVIHARWAEIAPGFRPAATATALAAELAAESLVIMPGSPDGRDLAPRLAAALDRPLVARAIGATVTTPGDGRGRRTSDEDASADRDRADGEPSYVVRAEVARVDDQVLVPVEVPGPVVVTLVSGGHHVGHDAGGSPDALVEELVLDGLAFDNTGEAHPVGDPQLIALIEPDLHTMDLSDATRVLAGGAGLVAGLDDGKAAVTFDLLVEVAAALGGSAGATRVATDAGWTGYERQIGTTGVEVDPDLYVAMGVSGAAQHVGGIGAPRHVVSVNTDPSCPMTSMADLGLVTDAGTLLAELADRLGVDVSDAGRSASVGAGRD